MQTPAVGAMGPPASRAPATATFANTASTAANTAGSSLRSGAYGDGHGKTAPASTVQGPSGSTLPAMPSLMGIGSNARTSTRTGSPAFDSSGSGATGLYGSSGVVEFADGSLGRFTVGTAGGSSARAGWGTKRIIKATGRPALGGESDTSLLHITVALHSLEDPFWLLSTCLCWYAANCIRAFSRIKSTTVSSVCNYTASFTSGSERVWPGPFGVHVSEHCDNACHSCVLN